MYLRYCLEIKKYSEYSVYTRSTGKRRRIFHRHLIEVRPTEGSGDIKCRALLNFNQLGDQRFCEPSTSHLSPSGQQSAVANSWGRRHKNENRLVETMVRRINRCEKNLLFVMISGIVIDVCKIIKITCFAHTDTLIPSMFVCVISSIF